MFSQAIPLIPWLILLPLALTNCQNVPTEAKDYDNPFYTKKFTSKDDRIMLFVGSNIDDTTEYMEATGALPAGVNITLPLSEDGLFTATDSQQGPIDYQAYLAGFDNSIFNITLDLSAQDIQSLSAAEPQKIESLKYIIQELKISNHPVFLHLGSLVDNSEKSIDPDLYQTTWKVITGMIHSLKAHNIATVWNVEASCQSLKNGSLEAHLDRWWPAQSETVDWTALSYQSHLESCKGSLSKTDTADSIFKYLSSKKKPILLTDIAPDSTHFKKDSPNIWSNWFKPLFKIVNRHKTHIKAISFSDTTWHSPQIKNKLASKWQTALQKSNIISQAHEDFFHSIHQYDQLSLDKDHNRENKAYSYRHRFHSIPGHIEAEHFDVGGPGIGYASNVKKINSQKPYINDCRRHENIHNSFIDAVNCSVNFNISENNQWLNYSVYSDHAFKGQVHIRYKLPQNHNGILRLDIDGKSLEASSHIVGSPHTSKFLTAVFPNVSFKKGRQLLTLHGLLNDLTPHKSSTDQFLEIDHIEIKNLSKVSPFLGHPIPIPGTLEAEFFNHGVSKEAYFDLSPSNKLSRNQPLHCFRDSDVELKWKDSKCVVTDFYRDEWLTYDIFVSQAGRYQLKVYGKNLEGDSSANLFLNELNEPLIENIKFPGSNGNEEDYVSIEAVLPYGKHTLKIRAKNPLTKLTNSSKTPRFASTDKIRHRLEFDRIEFLKIPDNNLMSDSDNSNQQKPFHKDPFQIPGIIEVGHYDHGGQGISYSDASSTNQSNYVKGEPCRTKTHVDTISYGGTCVLTNTEAKEWVEYTIQVDQAGSYDLNVVSYSLGKGGTFYLQLNGKGLTQAFEIPDSGSWQIPLVNTYQGITLPKGQHTLRLMMLEPNSKGTIGHLAYLEFLKNPIKMVNL